MQLNDKPIKSLYTMTTQKTSITLTAEELQVICYALNDKALEHMNKSNTWGND